VSVEIDITELRRFAADMNSASVRAAGDVSGLVAKGAVSIKEQMRSEMAASPHFRGAAASIGFDLVAFPDGLEAQVGPSSEPGSPGNLANVAYFGTSRGGGTVPDPRGALEAEAPRFERAVDELLGRLL
jgi:hypothetical protein